MKQMKGDRGNSRERKAREEEVRRLYGFDPFANYLPEPPVDNPAQRRDLNEAMREGRRSAGNRWPPRRWRAPGPEVGLSNSDPENRAAINGASRASKDKG